MRISFRRSRLHWLPSIVGFLQVIIVPIILVCVLNTFTTEHVPSTWGRSFLVKPWDWALTKSTPVFTLIEGFASLLVIQAIGQICRWVVNNRSDSWMVWELLLKLTLDCVSCIKCIYNRRSSLFSRSNLEFPFN
jgi:ICE2